MGWNFHAPVTEIPVPEIPASGFSAVAVSTFPHFWLVCVCVCFLFNVFLDLGKNKHSSHTSTFLIVRFLAGMRVGALVFPDRSRTLPSRCYVLTFC